MGIIKNMDLNKINDSHKIDIAVSLILKPRRDRLLNCSNIKYCPPVAMNDIGRIFSLYLSHHKKKVPCILFLSMA